MGSSAAAPVNPTHLLRHLKALEGERHPFFSRQRLEDAQTYVADQWRSWGLSVASHEFSYMGQRFVNLIARPHTNLFRTGGRTKVGVGARLIIGAHLDTVPGTPGADDNASGLAAMLEAARVVAQHAPTAPVEWVAFNLEELGMVGSAHYAASLRRQRTPILGMLSLEMVGFTESQGLQRVPRFLKGRFPVVGNYVGLAANRRSRQLLEAVAAAMRSVEGLPVETIVLPGNGWLLPDARLSDHAPFWDRGYPALLVTDTAYFRNPHYHQATDTIDTLDLDFLARVTQGVVAAVDAADATSGAAC